MPSTQGLYGSQLGGNMLRVGIAEAIGTFFLVFSGTAVAVSAALNRPIAGVAANSLAVALAFGLSLIALVGALGHISGGHFNPAVTIALAISKKFPWKYTPAYLVAQLLGAVAASVAVLAVFGEQAKTVVQLAVTSPALTATNGQVFLVELLITFFLMFVIISVATDNRVSSSVVGPSIGFALAVAVLIGGPISGGAVNPARAFGPMIVSGVYTGWWIYLLAPTIGAILAALIYDKFLAEAREPAKTETTS